jgi:hypothetical protein
MARKARRWRRVAPLLLGISALPVAFLSTLVACTPDGKRTNRQRAVESTSSAQPAAAQSPSAAPPPSTEPIVVSIDALPSRAKIFLDDMALESNPYEAERPRDARSHVIGFEAPGYEPQSASATFSENVHVHVELVPIRASAQPAAHPPPAARPPAAPTAK